MAKDVTLPTTRTRCLWVQDDLLYVGGEDSKLFVLDRTTLETKKTWNVRHLVSDVIAIGTRVYGTFGPGSLVTWEDRALGAEPTVTNSPAPNALTFAAHGDTLFYGTAWGNVYEHDSGQLGGVKKWLYSLAADATSVYAGHEDGKVRVYARDGAGKRPKVLSVATKMPAYAAVDTDGTLVTVTKTGTISRWRDGKVIATFERAVPSESTWGVIGIRVDDGWIITRTYEDVCVHARDGAVILAWAATESPTDNAIWAACRDGDTLLVAAYATVRRLRV